LQATIETQANTFKFEHPNLPIIEDLRDNYLPEVSQIALAPAAQFARERASESRWDRITTLENYAEILGVSDDVKNHADMYIKAGSVLGSLAVDQETGTVSLFAGLDCRNDFEHSLSSIGDTLPTNETKFALGALVKAEDRYVLTVNKYGHIFITEDEFKELMKGKTVAGKDAREKDGGFNRVITDLIKSNTSLVLWSHPMMQKQGSNRQSVMLFAHALARAYPDLNVVIDDPNPRVPELAAKIGQLTIAPNDIYVVIDTQYSVKFQGSLSDTSDEPNSHR
jgi:hypothetical protein